MAQILVRDVDKKVVDRLKAQAKRNGRSLQAEVKGILESATRLDPDTARKLALQLQRKLNGKKFSNSAELIREDRER